MIVVSLILLHQFTAGLKYYTSKRKSGKLSTKEVPNKPIIYSETYHPFLNKLHLSKIQWVKTLFFAITIFPIRLGVSSICIILHIIIAKIGLIGMSQNKPITGPRLILKNIGYSLFRIQLATFGIFTINHTGYTVTTSWAPVIVVAPHTSYLDICVILVAMGQYLTTCPFILIREDLQDWYLVGNCVRFWQCILVDRSSRPSKEGAKKEIQRRVLSGEGWQQFIIFPEGLLGNRRSMIRFKPGGFIPGVTVQPVLIRYDNELDTLSAQADPWFALFLTMCQPMTHAQVEFLPPYTPSQDEREDPQLFANNVQKLMAERLGIPICPHTYRQLKSFCKSKRCYFYD